MIAAKKLKMPLRPIVEQIKKQMNLVEMVVNAKRNIYAKFLANITLLLKLAVSKIANFLPRLSFYLILLIKQKYIDCKFFLLKFNLFMFAE